MANQKEYRIVINGVSESISQIDSLISKIDSLSKKIDNLNKNGISVNTSVGSVDTSSMQEVAQAQKQITVEIQKQTEALSEQKSFVDSTKQAESEVLQIATQILGAYDSNVAKLDELNQAIQRNKENQKEVAKQLKDELITSEQAATMRQRLLDEELKLKTARSEVNAVLKNEVKMNQANADSYDKMSQTLGRLKDALRASGSGLSPENFEKISRAIDAMDAELKSADKSIGNFYRQVGNYASAADGFQKITLTIGGATREFDSARTAIMELKNSMAQLVMSGQQGTEAYKDLENQMKNLQLAMVTVNDSIDRAKDASSGLHKAVEMIQGLTAIGSVGQGFASLFGIDNSELGEQIKKLTSLMAIMQGLQQLATQMATGTGIGNALKKVLDVSGINNNFANLKDNLKEIGVRLGVVKSEAATASSGMSNLSLAMKTAGNAAMTLGKSLAAALAATGIIWAISAAIDVLKGLYDAFVNAISITKRMERANKELEASIKGVNDALRYQLDEVNRNVMIGVIDEIDKYSEKLNYIKERGKEIIELYGNLAEAATKDIFGNEHVKVALVNIDEYNKEVKELQKLMANGFDPSDSWSNGLSGEKMQQVYKANETIAKGVGDIIAQYNQLDKTNLEVMQNWVIRIKEGEQYQWILNNAVKSSDVYLVQAATSLRNFVDGFYDGAVAARDLKTEINGMAAQMAAELAAFQKYGIQNMAAGGAKDAKNKQAEYLGSIGVWSQEQVDNYKKMTEAQFKQQTTHNRRTTSSAKKTANELLQFEKNLQADKLAVMRDGLTKTLAIIEEERRARLEAINKSAVSEKKKEEARVAANALYNQKALDAQKEYHEKYLKEERDFEARVLRETSDYANSSVSSISTDLDKAMNDLKKRLSEGIRHSAIPQMIDSKPISNEMKELYKTTLEAMAGFSQYESTLDLQLRKLMDDYKELLDTFDEGQPIDEESVKKLNEYVTAIRSTRNEMAKLDEVRAELIKNNKIYGNIDNAFSFDVADNRKIMAEYYREIASQSVEAMTLYQDQHLQALLDKMKADRKEIANAAEEELKEFDKLWENRLKDQSFIDKEFGGDSEKATEHMAQKRNEIENLYRLKDQAAYREYLDEKNKAEIETLDKGKRIYEDFYTSISRLYTDANTSIMNKISGLPDIMKNAFGTFNLGDYKSKLKEAASEMDALRDEVRLSLEGIREDWLNGWMDDETFYRLEREFSGMRDTIDENMSQVRDKLSSANGEWWKGIDEWIQQIASSFQQVLGAIFEYQNGEFDRMQEAIDKELEIVQKKYDEMEEMAQKHKDAMNEIEDELSTARGDRRQHLIDALSSEIQAQREALAKQKQYEKQKEALEKKSDALELDRKKAQRKQDIIQAILNGALAVSQAATNKWPIPAIPLMALAAAATAAQVAIMSATHYREGGLLHGADHEHGGIKLLGGQAEAEGGEFIINKKTTSKNLPLIDFVNSSKRKLNLDDFIDFYSGEKKGKRLFGAGGKFANGGLLPSVDLAERLVNVVVERDKAPIYVSVVDINRAQSRVATVEQLAGKY